MGHKDRGIFTGDLFGGLGRLGQADMTFTEEEVYGSSSGKPGAATSGGKPGVTSGATTKPGAAYTPFQASPVPMTTSADPMMTSGGAGGTDLTPYFVIGGAAVLGLGVVWFATRPRSRAVAANRRHRRGRKIAANRRRRR
jgi:hypothetical protein